MPDFIGAQDGSVKALLFRKAISDPTRQRQVVISHLSFSLFDDYPCVLPLAMEAKMPAKQRTAEIVNAVFIDFKNSG
jgi:hypothetical protein